MTTVRAGGYTIRGISLGGVYTTLFVDELGALFDVGIAARSFAATDHLFLSHGHADHVGGLIALLGIRALHGKKTAPRVYLPEEISDTLVRQLAIASEMQRYPLTIDPVPLAPGDEVQFRSDRWVRAFRTHHPVPSLGYQFLSRVKKLKPEFKDLPGSEIGRRRKAGEPLFDILERYELAYATDTLARVLDTAPNLRETKTLILECTFLDERKALVDSRRGCHIHLDELIEYADQIENETLVLMHFSQLYSPAEVHRILSNRCPPGLRERIVPVRTKQRPVVRVKLHRGERHGRHFPYRHPTGGCRNRLHFRHGRNH